MAYIDLEILAEVDGDNYLVQISKKDLHDLVVSEGLTTRHWDGDKPTVLEPYGEKAVRTKEDASESNNLAELPRLSKATVNSILG